MFLDTSGWYAAFSKAEHQHPAALRAYRTAVEAGIRLVTTDLVLAEMHILIGRARGPHAALRFLDSVHEDPTHDVVFVDRELERAAIDRWLRRFTDQPISLADAVSFEVMRTRRLTDALALDAHFQIAGYQMRPATT
jgi:uncharacterized protein